MVRIGLIAGTGMDSVVPAGRWIEVSTPYGLAWLADVTLGDREVVFLRRHGPALNVPPHLINYHANFFALREAGVERVIATAAAGSMRQDLPPGSLAVVGDFMDFTKKRNTTIFDRPMETVVHTDFSTPYCPQISSALETAAVDLEINLVRRVTYVCVDGPRYETPAEIRMFVQWGGDVVGMTGVPEVVLAREMGICYGSLAVLTNYAAGIVEKPLSHREVVAQASSLRKSVHSLIERAVTNIPERGRCCIP